MRKPSNSPRRSPYKRPSLAKPLLGLALGGTVLVGISEIWNKISDKLAIMGGKKAEVLARAKFLAVTLADQCGGSQKSWCECSKTGKTGILQGRNCVTRRTGDYYIGLYEIDPETDENGNKIDQARLVTNNFASGSGDPTARLPESISVRTKTPKDSTTPTECTLDAVQHGLIYRGIDCTRTDLLEALNTSLDAIFATEQPSAEEVARHEQISLFRHHYRKMEYYFPGAGISTKGIPMWDVIEKNLTPEILKAASKFAWPLLILVPPMSSSKLMKAMATYKVSPYPKHAPKHRIHQFDPGNKALWGKEEDHNSWRVVIVDGATFRNRSLTLHGIEDMDKIVDIMSSLRTYLALMMYYCGDDLPENLDVNESTVLNADTAFSDADEDGYIHQPKGPVALGASTLKRHPHSAPYSDQHSIHLTSDEAYERKGLPVQMGNWLFRGEVEIPLVQ